MKIGARQSEDAGGKWLLTFNDMVTLLLTFFVLILSMSKLDAPKLKEAASSMRSVFNLTERGEKERVTVFTPFVIPLGRGIPMDEASQAFERERVDLAERINREAQMIAEKIEKGTAAVPEAGPPSGEPLMEARVVEDGVSVSLGEKLLFETGKVEIGGKIPALDALSVILKETDCRIRVEGNTDEIPISTEQFPSNWELSVARAVNVVKYLVSPGGISPERLSAAGYADSRPRVEVVNDGSRELNRRVDILLMLNRNGGGRSNG
jgi:chemotaxis protein MotB